MSDIPPKKRAPNVRRDERAANDARDRAANDARDRAANDARDRATGRAGVVKRLPGDRRPLPPEAQAVDRGEPIWRARKREPRGPELRDPRAEAMVAGVANRAARKVYDAMVAALRTMRERVASEACTDADREAFGDALLDASRLAVWEARRVVGFDAFAEGVVGIGAREAHELVAAAETRCGWTCGAIPPYARAVVLRSRAVLLEAAEAATGSEAPAAAVGAAAASVRTTGDGAALRIVIDVPGPEAAAAFAAVGRVLFPLAEDLARGPERTERPMDRGPRGPRRGG